MRGSTIAITLFGLLAVTGPVKAGGAKSPEEAFQAMTKAAAKEDIKDMMASLSKDSQKVFTGHMVAMGVSMKQLTKFLGVDPTELNNALKKHDINDEKILAQMKALEGPGKKADPEAILKGIRALGDLPKDPAAFSAEVLKALKKFDKTGKDDPIKELAGAKLKEEKIKAEKDAAKAVVVLAGMEKEIHFVLEEGAWRVNLVPMILAELKKGF